MPPGRIKRTDSGSNGASEVGECSRPENILARDAATSPEALEELCDLYIPKIYGYVLKRVGSVQDAEDITSTVFEKVLINLDTFDGSRASFSTWIYKIATNCVTDFYRVRGRRREQSAEEDSSGAVLSADEDVERIELYMVLLDMLRSLPAKYQEAVTLRYFAGMSVTEIAQTLGITDTAASKRVLRGLNQLRRLARGGPLEGHL